MIPRPTSGTTGSLAWWMSGSPCAAADLPPKLLDVQRSAAHISVPGVAWWWSVVLGRVQAGIHQVCHEHVVVTAAMRTVISTGCGRSTLRTMIFLSS